MSVNTYLTVQNMIDGLGAPQLARILDVDPESYDFALNATLAQKVAAANGQIDTYIRSRIKGTLVEVPAQIIEHGVAIATWFLVSTRPEVEREGDKTRYDDAMKYLKDIASGKGSTDFAGSVDIVGGAEVVRTAGARLVGSGTCSVRIIDTCNNPEGRI